jgi:hypothetical protein
MQKHKVFVKKKYFIVPILREVRFFCVVLRPKGEKKYLLKIVFPNFDPLTAIGMALCVDLGPKCQNLFSLVSVKAEFLRLFFKDFSLVLD